MNDDTVYYSILSIHEYTVTRPPGHWGKKWANGEFFSQQWDDILKLLAQLPRPKASCAHFISSTPVLRPVCCIWRNFRAWCYETMQHLVCKESGKKVFFESSLTRLNQQKHQQEWSLGTGTPQLDPTGRSSESSALMLGNIWFNIFNPQSSRSGRRSLVKRKVGRQRPQPVDFCGWNFGISDGNISPDQQLTSKKTWWFQMIHYFIMVTIH